MRRASAGKSSAPPGCIGVTIATRLPESMKYGVEKTRFYPIPPRPRALAAGAVPRSSATGSAQFEDSRRQARHLVSTRADRRQALHDRRPNACEPTLLECDDRKPPAGDVEQLV